MVTGSTYNDDWEYTKYKIAQEYIMIYLILKCPELRIYTHLWVDAHVDAQNCVVCRSTSR